MAKSKKENIEKLVSRILEESFWLADLQTDTTYERQCDDTNDKILLRFDRDGDAWMRTTNLSNEPLMFRMNFIGGGKSLRTRNALLILALAMKMDNEEDDTKKT